MTPTPEARMPRQVPYIIASEGCERFSFYGMRNILIPFLVTSLLLHIPDESLRRSEAKSVLHTFMMGVYFFPLLGGWLADRFFGKFNTILWFSLIYCAGHACLAFFENSVTGFMFGLFLIALGAGGIKPLVASFVGDQFDERTKHLAKRVFDAFYWIINFGSFFASLLMPVFLAELGPQIAFGIPGALMFIATIVLYAARRHYVMVPVAPSNPNSFMRVVRTALSAPDGRVGLLLAIIGVIAAGASFLLIGKLDIVPIIALAFVALIVFGGIGTWINLDKARGKHSDAAVDGVAAVLRVLIVFALVTPFHSLFDQKASTWVLQGGDMNIPHAEFDLWILGTWETNFQPAQMQAFNPLLVMLLIPFNNFVLYPWLRRRGWDPTSLRRMTWGIAFAGFAWIVAGAIQLVIDDGFAAVTWTWTNGTFKLETLAPASKLNILWQIAPYALLTFGEVLVSATGLEFAYSQAPLAMKGVIMSFWNLTTTIGNLWVLLADAGVRGRRIGIENTTGLSETAFLMFFFAVFALVVAFIFKLYVKRYTVIDNYRSATKEPEKVA